MQMAVQALPGEIKGQFQCWALFLIANPNWLLAENEATLKGLYAQFEAFGRAIGDDNAAVWFFKKLPEAGRSIAEDTDVERCVRYVQLYGLKASRSPLILVVAAKPDEGKTAYPSLEKKLDSYYVIEMNGLSAGRQSQVIAELTDQFVAQHMSAKAFASMDQWNLIHRTIAAVSKPIAEIAQHISIKFKSGPFEMEWKGKAP
jgi:hypothetical protein